MIYGQGYATSLVDVDFTGTLPYSTPDCASSLVSPLR